MNEMVPGRNLRVAGDFFLVNCVLLFITQPGSLVLAGFDPPYGLVRDLTTWLSAFVGLSVVTVIFLLVHRKSIGRWFPPATASYVCLVLITAYTAYTLQQPLFEGFRAAGYEQGFLMFLAASPITAALSLMLLPAGLLPVNYLENSGTLALGGMNLILLLVIVLLWRSRSPDNG